MKKRGLFQDFIKAQEEVGPNNGNKGKLSLQKPVRMEKKTLLLSFPSIQIFGDVPYINPYSPWISGIQTQPPLSDMLGFKSHQISPIPFKEKKPYFILLIKRSIFNFCSIFFEFKAPPLT